MKICTVILFFVAMYSFGCAVRPETKPRSTVIEEARDRGVYLSSIDEDRALFFDRDKKQRSRLIDLITQRARAQGGDGGSDYYRVGVGDELSLFVFDVPELNVTVKVDENGFATFPLLGAINVAGRTLKEVEAGLGEQLPKFIRDPQFRISIAEYGSQLVSVMGAVKEPGAYPLKRGSNTVLDLIGEAGGINERAGNFVQFVPAELSGMGSSISAEDRAKLALRSLEGDSSKDLSLEVPIASILGTSGGIPVQIPVRGGDMIVVPEGGFVTADGEVQKPGRVELSRGMTLLGALAASEGITYSAEVNEIELIRRYGNSDVVHYVVNLEQIGEDPLMRDVLLKSGDVIRVPSNSGRKLSQDTFRGISNLINFGVGGTVPLR